MPDPALARIPRDALPPRLGDLHDAAMRDRGEAVLIEAAGNAPETLEWYYDRFYGEMFHRGRVAVRLKQLARMKLSTLHGCAFCNRGNRLAALEAGVTQAQLDALGDPASPVFDAAERAVLRLAEQIEMSNFDGHLSPALHAELSPHFDDGQIFELGMVMAILTGMAKFLFVFDLVSREAACPMTAPPASQGAEAAG
ncbi:MAG: carboxymuconolactone decarboxylase family protein [Pseudomonadota bacterium]